MYQPMTALVGSETNEIFADYQRGNLRSGVIILRIARKSGAVFRKLFLTPQKSGFHKLSFARHSRRLTFKSAFDL
jgi:hypothetical protein